VKTNENNTIEQHKNPPKKEARTKGKKTEKHSTLLRLTKTPEHRNANTRAKKKTTSNGHLGGARTQEEHRKSNTNSARENNPNTHTCGGHSTPQPPRLQASHRQLRSVVLEGSVVLVQETTRCVFQIHSIRGYTQGPGSLLSDLSDGGGWAWVQKHAIACSTQKKQLAKKRERERR
jgi:hypothetical protein